MSISVNLKEDIYPISDFRTNTTSLLKKMKELHRPIVLTQNGKSSAIVLDIGDFQNMVEELELVKDLLRAEQRISEGEFYTHDKAKEMLMKRFKNG